MERKIGWAIVFVTSWLSLVAAVWGCVLWERWLWGVALFWAVMCLLLAAVPSGMPGNPKTED